MKTLDKKVVRDAIRLAAVATVMACGVAVLVMSWSMLRSLDATHREYAAQARFADVFVHLKRAHDRGPPAGGHPGHRAARHRRRGDVA